MYSFIYHTPTEVRFGRKAEDEIGSIIATRGFKKVLVHYGGGSAVRSGLLGRIVGKLDESGVSHVELGGVVPNPRLSLVHKGIELARKEKVDLVLAVGGGSVIDSSKAIALGAADGGEVWDFYSGKRRPSSCLPVGVVLTLSATGSEMSNSSVITCEDSRIKKGINTPLIRPLFAVMDPELTLTLPDYQTACGCTDIVMHTLERWFAPREHMEITDAIAAALMRTVMRQAAILRDDPSNYDARAEVMWAGSLSHNGLTGCGACCRGDWTVHGMEHEIGAIWDVAHGAGLAAVWASWARYVVDAVPERFVKLATDVLGIKKDGKSDMETALEGIAAMEAFFKSIGMPTSMKELGIEPTEEQMAHMARQCVALGGGTKGEAKVLHAEDVLEIYRRAR